MGKFEDMTGDSPINEKPKFNFRHWWKLELTRGQRAAVGASAVVMGVMWILFGIAMFSIGWWPIGVLMIGSIVWSLCTAMFYDLGNDYDETGKVTYRRNY
jgi:hypothetical protein